MFRNSRQAAAIPPGGTTMTRRRMGDALDDSLEFSSRTLPEVLTLQSRLGDRILVRSSTGHVLTYAESPERAARIAGRLAAAGLGPGDRILVLLSNRIELLELWLGATWLGAVLVPVNTALRGEQLYHAISVAAPSAVVTEHALLDHLRYPRLELSGSVRLWLVDSGESAPAPVHGIPVHRFPDAGETAPRYPVHPGDPVAILFTSGTSGPSKGVVCPHAQFFWWGIHTGNALGVRPGDVLFTTLPFFHTNALNTFWQAVLAGATYSFASRFSASLFWEQARDAGATLTYLLGAMTHILLKRRPTAVDRDHSIRVALSPATSPELVARFEERFGVRLVEGYGSTETNLVMSNTIGGFVPGAMGRVVDGFEARVVDEQDCEVAQGTAGELLIRHREPFSIASGYYRNPQATVEAWRNLWFHTGDRVVQGEDGVYYFLDRQKDSIRRRGENISSWEVEHALLAHPDVVDAAVVGTPAELGEEEVVGFVVLGEGLTPDPKMLIEFLMERLAYFAIPRYLEFVEELPKTENGKVRKYVLKQQSIGPGTWDRETAGIDVKRRT